MSGKYRSGAAVCCHLFSFTPHLRFMDLSFLVTYSVKILQVIENVFVFETVLPFKFLLLKGRLFH